MFKIESNEKKKGQLPVNESWIFETISWQILETRIINSDLGRKNSSNKLNSDQLIQFLI